MRVTDSGLMFEIVDEVSTSWCNYDQEVAKAHIHNYGRIFVGEDGYPIDNEHSLSEIVSFLKN